jgi:hypothetical protein
MRILIALIVVVYLVGVGVALAPTVEGKWNTATVAELLATVGQALPHAFAWPVAAYHSITGKETPQTKSD